MIYTYYMKQGIAKMEAVKCNGQPSTRVMGDQVCTVRVQGSLSYYILSIEKVSVIL